ncbi:MAG TPA: hypothetical protein VFJ87_05725 [Rhodanobacteraceae bacterium]|jgi:hypothetical protein|nr:hypothetical protein [Rhodanobacteraceae bacterium]
MNNINHQVFRTKSCKASYWLRYPPQQRSAHRKRLRNRSINH